MYSPCHVMGKGHRTSTPFLPESPVAPQTPEPVFSSLLAGLFVLLQRVPSPFRLPCVTHPSLQLTVMFCWRLPLQMMRRTADLASTRVWRVGLSHLMIYCHRDRRWAPGHVRAGLPLPHCLVLFPDLGPLAHSVPRARPAQSHMLAGTWLAGRREAGKERNAISSLRVCLPFSSGCFN